MGLDLGPPWLVVGVHNADGASVVYRDNFTGAGFDRVRKVMKDVDGSFAAVMNKTGEFAYLSNGQIFDPIENTRGKNFGTSSDRGHRALLMANDCFRAQNGNDPNDMSQLSGTTKWILSILALFFFFAFIGSL